MRRTLITLLAVVTLLTQWSWFEHGYADHDKNDVCETCLSAAGHVAITPGMPPLPQGSGGYFETAYNLPFLAAAATRFYPARAPPRFL